MFMAVFQLLVSTQDLHADLNKQFLKSVGLCVIKIRFNHYQTACYTGPKTLQQHAIWETPKDTQDCSTIILLLQDNLLSSLHVLRGAYRQKCRTLQQLYNFTQLETTNMQRVCLFYTKKLSSRIWSPKGTTIFYSASYITKDKEFWICTLLFFL